MSEIYRVNITRLPLPLGPLGQGYLDRRPVPINRPAKFSTFDDAIRWATSLVNQGYGGSIETPDGEEWTDFREQATRKSTYQRAKHLRDLDAVRAGRVHGPGSRAAAIAELERRIAEINGYLARY